MKILLAVSMFDKLSAVSCPQCHHITTVKGEKSIVLVCLKCGTILLNHANHLMLQRIMPDDFSVVQIGSTGVHKEKRFEVIGRIRLQLRNEYKNFWCVLYSNEKRYGWLVESFASYMMCESNIFEMKNRAAIAKLRSGKEINVGSNVKVKIDFVEKCEWLSYEGELCEWHQWSPGFFTAQGQNNNGIVAFFHVQPSQDIAHFLVGELTSFNALNLTTIRAFDEYQ